MATDFKTALDTAMLELETSPPDAAAATTGPSTAGEPAAIAEKEEAKAAEGVEEVEELFKAADFFPAEEVAVEKELSFEGQGLKLNTEEDAKGR